jgi:transcriptional regulator with XRE-family HTH domain
MNIANGKVLMTDGLGDFLRRERELRHISLDDVAERTKISRRYLEAIEDGQYDRLPGETFIRGFIRSYAQSMGLDPQDTLLMYNQSRRIHEVPSLRAERTAPPPRQRWRQRSALWLLVAGGALAGAVLIGIVALRAGLQALPWTSTSDQVVQDGPASGGPLILTAIADSDTWLHIRIDEETSQDMLLRAGQSAKWVGGKRFVLSIGNARATHLKLNGHDLSMPQPTPSLLRHYTITRDMLP